MIKTYNTFVTFESFNIEDEMKLWDKRGKDSFGKDLSKVRYLMSDYEENIDMGNGVNTTVTTNLFIQYTVDGDKKVVAKNLINYMINYDFVTVNDEGVIDTDIPTLLPYLQSIVDQAKLKPEEIFKMSV